ncbi:type VI secretion system ImpA family N-terminal domain-containing protein [Erwinia sp. BNK-24-b]|uniref:type VI secretion system ImpA family N-terminal domain-containing protein n=1 Tax=unclassified Erwinia TaxID=2622719 RepID=UPI0039BFFF30
MTEFDNNILHTGGDPRALPEFSALRQEIAKLNTVSNSETDWQQVERQAIALFRANGMDLQSVAWYTRARAHNAGLAGLCEGIEIITAMIRHQWPTLWPQPLPARLAIITWLSTGVQQIISESSYGASDLELLLHLREQLEQNVATLEELAHKHLSQLDRLVIQVATLTERLAAPQSETKATALEALKRGNQAASNRYGEFTPLIYVPRDLTTSSALNLRFSFWERSRGFIAGVAATLVLSGLTVWAWQLIQPEPDKAQRVAMLAQRVTPEQSWQRDKWQQMMTATALPTEQLGLWHTAQLRLQKLAEQVGECGEVRTACLSRAELEAQLVTIQQPLQAMLPVEELLRRLEADNSSPVLRGKIEHRIKQQLARYALILHAARQSVPERKK